MPQKILIIDDEKSICQVLTILLSSEGYEVEAVHRGEDGFNLLRRREFDLLLLDLRLPGMNGLEILKKVKADYPLLHVIIMTSYASVDSAIEAMKLGAYDYITKPFMNDEIKLNIRKIFEVQRISRENLRLKKELRDKYCFEGIVAMSGEMKNVCQLIAKLTYTKSNILLSGESGTGKSLVAKVIHFNSFRGKKRFISINCGAIPENLLESELFGHKKGAFTSAYEDKVGLFQVADGGTVLLDEIGDLPPSMQVKLLHAIQEREIHPLGFTEPLKVDIRIIAATSKDLEEEVRQGHFREDLYYRLNVISTRLPPLRERKEDIPLLVNHILKRLNHELTKSIHGVDRGVMEAFMEYRWPGNIREMENVLEYAMTMAEGDLITLSALPDRMRSCFSPAPEKKENLAFNLEWYERRFILQVLGKYREDKNLAAAALGIDLATLYRKIKRYNLQIQD